MWRYEPNTLLNADCLPVMREMPDKFFKLAIVDPPYGIGNDGQKRKYAAIRNKAGRNTNGRTGTVKAYRGQNISGSLKEYLKIR